MAQELVRLTFHAVDRASVRLAGMRREHGKGRGVVGWLEAYATEAWAHGLRLPREVSVPGRVSDFRRGERSRVVLDGRVILAFREEDRGPVLATVWMVTEPEAASLRRAALAADAMGVKP